MFDVKRTYKHDLLFFLLVRSKQFVSLWHFRTGPCLFRPQGGMVAFQDRPVSFQASGRDGGISGQVRVFSKLSGQDGGISGQVRVFSKLSGRDGGISGQAKTSDRFCLDWVRTGHYMAAFSNHTIWFKMVKRWIEQITAELSRCATSVLFVRHYMAKSRLGLLGVKCLRL
jgi:hypothetical protein